jgi:hypothetical protein
MLAVPLNRFISLILGEDDLASAHPEEGKGPDHQLPQDLDRTQGVFRFGQSNNCFRDYKR